MKGGVSDRRHSYSTDDLMQRLRHESLDAWLVAQCFHPFDLIVLNVFLRRSLCHSSVHRLCHLSTNLSCLRWLFGLRLELLTQVMSEMWVRLLNWLPSHHRNGEPYGLSKNCKTNIFSMRYKNAQFLFKYK